MDKKIRKTGGFKVRSLFKTDKGFTLLEVLLAFFIFSILFITIYSTYSGSFKTINMTENRMELYRKAAIVMEKISEDLQGGYISHLPPSVFGEQAAYTRFLGEDNDMNGMDADTLSFFSTTQPLFSDKGETGSGQLISYSVIPGSGEDELILLRSEHPEFIDATEKRAELILSDGLQAINFTFIDDDVVHESWDSDSEEFSGRLPRMVTISLEFLDHENPETPFRTMTSVALPIN